MDFSNFLKNNFLFSEKNRKALLHMKDENPNDFITEFIGLRSKLYVIKTVSDQEQKRCKGYKRSFRDSYLSFQKYKDCHKNLSLERLPLITICGIDHELYSVLQNKIVLNNFDSKMFICNCNIHTYFYGSNEIKDFCEKCKN